MDEARRFLTTKGSPATSSMYRDVQRGARTESDHILRDLYLRAVAKGAVAPMLRIAVCNLEMHEQRLRVCEKTVASEGRSRSAGAQEPQCILKYMRIPSTAGTRDPER
ncbi:MAG: ketopantoate reductase family protein, partial [Gammaproteobacteria bacterium]